MSSFVIKSEEILHKKRRIIPKYGLSLVKRDQQEQIKARNTATKVLKDWTIFEPTQNHPNINASSRDKGKKERSRNTTNHKRYLSFEDRANKKPLVNLMSVKQIKHAQVLNKGYDIVRNFNKVKQRFVSPRGLQNTIQKGRELNKVAFIKKDTLINSHADPALPSLKKQHRRRIFSVDGIRRTQSPTNAKYFKGIMLHHTLDKREENMHKAFSRRTQDHSNFSLEQGSVDEFIKKYDAELKKYEIKF